MAHIPMTRISGHFAESYPVDPMETRTAAVDVDFTQLQRLGERGHAMRVALTIMQDEHLDAECDLSILARQFLRAVGN